MESLQARLDVMDLRSGAYCKCNQSILEKV